MDMKAFGRELRFTWAAAIDLLIDAILGALWFSLLLTLIVGGLSTLPALGIGIIFLFVASALTRFSGWVERSRASALYEVDIAAPMRRQPRQTGALRYLAMAFTDLIDPVTWRTILHHLVSVVLGGGLLVLWSAGWRLLSWLVERDDNAAAMWAAAAGTLLVLVLYVAAAGRLDRWLSVALLGPTKTSQLRARVDTLADARRGAVDAAAIERQRIERDLHDGVQPQLVSVAMTIGMARAKLDSDPQAARELLDQAHATAKGTITELRQLARGIHPAVLADRGLDAALSAVASRCAVPTTLTVTVPGRVPADAEAVVYFSVAEALTNVAKHSQATACSVTVSLQGEGQNARLLAVIRDNGVGGASMGEGLSQGGLAGMQGRVRAAGGALIVDSPVGGPTTITVEVPCVS